MFYVVGTPIGNLEDITFRAIKVLKEVDYIFAEDTRVTKKLLSHYEIEKTVYQYHEHNKLHQLLQVQVFQGWICEEWHTKAFYQRKKADRNFSIN